MLFKAHLWLCGLLLTAQIARATAIAEVYDTTAPSDEISVTASNVNIPIPLNIRVTTSFTCVGVQMKLQSLDGSGLFSLTAITYDTAAGWNTDELAITLPDDFTRSGNTTAFFGKNASPAVAAGTTHFATITCQVKANTPPGNYRLNLTSVFFGANTPPFEVTGTAGTVYTVHVVAPLPPPMVTGWRSVRTHTGPADLSIALNATATGNGSGGPTVETRTGGIQSIEVDFDQAVSLVNSSAVTVSGQSTVGGVLQGPVPYSGAVSMLSSTVMQIAFAPGALPDQTCYTISVAGAVQNVNAQGLLGDADVNVRALLGDTTMSGDVNLSDALLIQPHLGQVAAAVPALAVSLGDTISPADALATKAQVSSPAHLALCP